MKEKLDKAKKEGGNKSLGLLNFKGGERINMTNVNVDNYLLNSSIGRKSVTRFE